MIKKGISFIFGFLLLINNVTASSLDYFFDSNSIMLMIVFFFIFYISYFAINKSMKYSNTAIKTILSLSISLFTVWKLNNSDIGIDGILFDLGLTEFIKAYGPIIIIIGLIIAMFVWGFCMVMAIAGGIITLIGYIGQESGILYNGWFLTAVGIGMLFLGLLCIHRSYIKKASNFIGSVKKPVISLCGFFAFIGLIIFVVGIVMIDTTLIIIGLIIFLLGIICPGKKKYKDGESSPWYPSGSSSPWKPDIKTKRKQKTRLWGSLQRKYNEYSRRIQNITTRNNKRIPSSGTSDGKEYSRLVRAMGRLEKIAKIKGIKLR